MWFLFYSQIYSITAPPLPPPTTSVQRVLSVWYSFDTSVLSVPRGFTAAPLCAGVLVFFGSDDVDASIRTWFVEAEWMGRVLFVFLELPAAPGAGAGVPAADMVTARGGSAPP